MKWIFFLHSLASLSVFIILTIGFLRHARNKKINHAAGYLFFIGIIYAIMSLFSFLWFLDYLEYREIDFLFIYSFAILVQSVLLFMLIYSFSGNRKLFYFLFLYLMVFLSFFSSSFNFLYLFLITSFLLTLLFFINLAYRSEIYKKIGFSGMFYSSLSLIFYFFLLFKIGEVFLFSFFSTLIFLMPILEILEVLKKNPPLNKGPKAYKESSYLITLIRHFIFILILTNFVFIATIAVHEFGHFMVAEFYNCEYTRIVYESNFPYTEALCSNISNSSLVTFGGIFLPFLISLFLFIVGGKFIKEISLLISGFNLIASSRDFLDFGFSENIVLGCIILGILFLIFGVLLLAKARTEDYIFT